MFTKKPPAKQPFRHANVLNITYEYLLHCAFCGANFY